MCIEPGRTLRQSMVKILQPLAASRQVSVLRGLCSSFALELEVVARFVRKKGRCSFMRLLHGGAIGMFAYIGSDLVLTLSPWDDACCHMQKASAST